MEKQAKGIQAREWTTSGTDEGKDGKHVLQKSGEAGKQKRRAPRRRRRKDHPPVHLVELRVDVLDGVFEFGHDDVLDRVDASIRRADHLVQDGECGLRR